MKKTAWGVALAICLSTPFSGAVFHQSTYLLLKYDGNTNDNRRLVFNLKTVLMDILELCKIVCT